MQEVSITYTIIEGSQTKQSRAEIGTSHFLRSRSRAKREYTAHQISQPHHYATKDAEASLGSTCRKRSDIQ